MEAADVAAAVGVVVVEADNIIPMFIPTHLTVQWHITDVCNLRCQHCYQSEYQGKHNTFAELKATAEHILQFHQQLSASRKIPLLLTLTGGEPFAHPDFIRLLQFLNAHPLRPHIAILTNGTLFNHSRLQKISDIPLAFIQLSLDGDRDVHDKIRGEGNFIRTLAATKKLKEKNKRVLWSFTVHKNNAHTFSTVAKLAGKYKVDRLWFDRLIPCKENIPDTLNQIETQKFFHSASQIKQKAEKPSLIQRLQGEKPQTEIAMLRALQFQYSATNPYHCQAGSGLITIMPDGDVYPCRRLPIAVGNINQTPLMTLYQTSTLFKQLREFSWPGECEKCLFKAQCKGGLRCLAWAVKDNAFVADPGCPFAAGIAPAAHIT